MRRTSVGQVGFYLLISSSHGIGDSSSAELGIAIETDISHLAMPVAVAVSPATHHVPERETERGVCAKHA